MDDAAAGIRYGAGHFVAIRRPIAGLGEIELAADAHIAVDDKVAVLVNPALAAKEVVDARCNFVPGIMIVVFREPHVDRSCFGKKSRKRRVTKNESEARIA